MRLPFSQKKQKKCATSLHFIISILRLFEIFIMIV